MPLTSRTLTPPDPQLGPYYLCFEVGSGGMASVYLSKGPGEQLYAVKVLHPHIANRPNLRDMFLDEARIAAQLDHPNTCSVFDFGEQRGRAYMAMEYLHGVPLERLHKRLAEKPLPVDLCCAIVAAVARGLQAAHELRDEHGNPLEVVHRDVSPHNIFVLFDGGVRLLDFGVAKTRNQIHDTVSGELRGKLGYTAPELLRHQAATPASDVWSLGTVFWELLAGRRLFVGSNESETVAHILHREVPSLRSEPNVTPAIATVVEGMLERDPNKRFASMREVIVALDSASQSFGASDRNLSLWLGEHYRQDDEAGRARMIDANKVDTTRKRPWAVVAAGVLALLGGVVAAAWMAPTTKRAGDSLSKADSRAERYEASPFALRNVIEPVRVEPATDAGLGTDDADRVEPTKKKLVIRPRRRKNNAQPVAENPTKAPPALGTLSLQTTGGWAYIYDQKGKLLGETPRRLQLPAGTQKLSIRPRGQPPAIAITVRISAGKTTHKVVNLPSQ